MTPFKKILAGSFIFAVMLIFSACSRHEIELKPVEIKPIHITIDINVKVDRALDDFFSDLDNTSKQ